MTLTEYPFTDFLLIPAIARNMLIPEQDLRIAYERVQQYFSPSPLIRSHYFSRKLDAEIWFKLEMLQPTHSFKLRGALNAVLSLSPEQRAKGVVTASAGNHGLGVSLVASMFGIPARIYLPIGTSQSRVDAISALGAEAILHGEVWDESNREALQFAADEDWAHIHSFDSPHVMAGQGTILYELQEQLSNIDRIVLSIGGGGLISGILSARAVLMPETKVVGVEPLGADCVTQSIRWGEVVTLPAITSIADSLGAKKTTDYHFQLIRQYADQLVNTSDSASIDAILEVLEYEKLLIEPAAACNLAAFSEGSIDYSPGERIVVIICGANVSFKQVMQWVGEKVK